MPAFHFNSLRLLCATASLRLKVFTAEARRRKGYAEIYCLTPTLFVNIPMRWISMRIVSSIWRVKSLGGTRQVPVMRKQPNGKSHSLYKKSANSVCVRFILLISTESVYRTSPLRIIFMEMVVSGEIGLRVR